MTLRPLIRLVATVICILPPLSGCGSDGLLHCAGDVTLDGEPLADGTIEFRPTDGRGATAGELIQRGSYMVRLAPGEYDVVIHAFRTTGQEHANPDDPESPLVPVREEIPLEQYTEESQTTVKISSGGDVDFQLRSSP